MTETFVHTHSLLAHIRAYRQISLYILELDAQSNTVCVSPTPSTSSPPPHYTEQHKPADRPVKRFVIGTS